MVDAKVIAVLGGDSFQVLIGKEKVIVNLQGIQPPEDKWSPNSKQYLNQMIYSDLKNVCCSNKISTEQKNFHPNAIAEISDALIRHNESLLDGKYAVNLVKFISDANHLATENKQELKTENYEISHS